MRLPIDPRLVEGLALYILSVNKQPEPAMKDVRHLFAMVNLSAGQLCALVYGRE